MFPDDIKGMIYMHYSAMKIQKYWRNNFQMRHVRHPL